MRDVEDCIRLNKSANFHLILPVHFRKRGKNMKALSENVYILTKNLARVIF